MPTITLEIRLTPIELRHWNFDEPKPLVFPFSRKGFHGTITLELKPENIRLEVEPVIDQETGDVDTVEYPADCNKISVCVSGTRADGSQTAPLPVIQESPASAWFLKEAKYSQADLDFLVLVKELTLELVGKFVDNLNFRLGQVWVSLGRTQEGGLWYFLRECGAEWLDLETGQTEPVIATGNLHFKATAEDPTVYEGYSGIGLDVNHWRTLQEELSSGSEVRLANRLLLNAQRSIANGDFRSAVVECISALEVELAEFLAKSLKGKGVSNGAWKKYAKELGIAGQIKILLPLVLGIDDFDKMTNTSPDHKPLSTNEKEQKYQSTIQEILQLNALRNEIVHSGRNKFENTSEIERGINAAGLLIQLFQSLV